MPSLEVIKKRILKIEPIFGKRLVGRVELESLPRIIRENETINAIVTGVYKESEGIVLATDHRIIHLGQSAWAQFPYSDITTIKSTKVEFSDGKTLESIQLVCRGGRVEIRRIPYDTVPFIKQVKHLITSHRESPHSIQKDSFTQNTNRSPKKRKRTIFSLLVVLFILAGAYTLFGVLLPSNASPTSLGFTPTQFHDRWNKMGEEINSGYKVNELEMTSDGQDQSFTYFLTPDLKMIGIISKDQMVKKIMLLGKMDSQLPELIEQTIMVTDATLSKPERQRLLHDLGFSNQKQEDQQITKNHIRYTVIYPPKIGIVFEATIANN